MKTLFAQSSSINSTNKYIFVDQSEDVALDIIQKQLYITPEYIRTHYTTYVASSFKSAWELFVSDLSDPLLSYDNIISSSYTKVISTKCNRVTLPSGNDGMYCAHCEEFFPYAEPNQLDGSMVCYGCRSFSF